MPKTIFVNLPVTDIAASTRFYEAIGCKKNDQFSDETSSQMVWSDTITFQLLTREKFASFAPKAVADAQKACQVLLALSCDSRADVDKFADQAAAHGGNAKGREPIDLGWLYNRLVQDPDGHVLEAVWADMSAMK